MSNEAEMPRYQSHKIVHALKLDRVRHSHNVDGEMRGDTCVLYPEDKKYDPIEVDAKWCNSKISIKDHDDCGYLVVYADGYRSWSPTHAFEHGYTRL